MAHAHGTNVARERLEQAVQELTESEGWRRWLETRARFHDYSLGNTMLIALQRPDATQVAGYKAWQKLGRQVRKGEKGIAILAPVTRKVEELGDPNRHLGADRRDREKVIVSYRTVYVFDVAQTDGEELSAAPVRLLAGDDGAALGTRLLELAAAEGLAVDTEVFSGGRNGYVDRAERRIVLGDRLSPSARAKTLAHELAHWFDLGPAGGLEAYDRDAAEIVAESVAYIVGAAAGLDTSEYSVGYVASWAAGDAGKVRELAERIDKAAGPMLARLAGPVAEAA